MIRFEWDSAKDRRNQRAHDVAFREAASVFQDPLGITTYDPDHSHDEDRHITIGLSASGRFLMVNHTDRSDVVRIISARKLTRNERKSYEREIQRRKG